VATALAVLLALWALYHAWPRSMTWVRSDLTGKTYHVKDAPGAQDVADRLAFLELRVRRFLDRAQEYAPGDPRVRRVKERWNGTLAETPQDRDVAYSVGKDAIHLCVRSAEEAGGLEPENTSMFVLMHELAHLATDEYGHPPEFWSNMRFLLELAERTGSYAYQDFEANRVSYCGHAMASSPLTCVKSGACVSQLGRKKIPQST
jgi:hypothetical protein